MSQVALWLETLGMAEYAERFVENRIELSVLRELTDQDLKDLGIVLGDRRKLLRAIRELDAPAPATAADAAERRQLTLMFCDLVGSTTLSASLDPEDLRAIIGAYHRCCAETVERLGGFVAKYMGDGVLVYFGYPQAREHDAEHAVEAGLGLVEAVPRLVTPPARLCRSGWASPPAWSWSAISSGRDRPRSAAWWARRPTLPRGCRGSPSRMRW